jgi:hypothetical protein
MNISRKSQILLGILGSILLMIKAHPNRSRHVAKKITSQDIKKSVIGPATLTKVNCIG